ncbi:MAG: hypothetical protein ACLR23_28380 [Clostridia bacterium]
MVKAKDPKTQSHLGGNGSRVTAAVILLTGTFAWQSISQTALNEATVNIRQSQVAVCTTISTAANKDVYVEKFQ